MCLFGLFISSLALSGCKGSLGSLKPVVLQDVLQRGNTEFHAAISQPIVINQVNKNGAASALKWKVALGRLDFEKAKFRYDDEKIQQTMHFTKAGVYLITLTSLSEGHKPNVMQYALTAIIE